MPLVVCASFRRNTFSRSLRVVRSRRVSWKPLQHSEDQWLQRSMQLITGELYTFEVYVYLLYKENQKFIFCLFVVYGLNNRYQPATA